MKNKQAFLIIAQTITVKQWLQAIEATCLGEVNRFVSEWSMTHCKLYLFELTHLSELHCALDQWNCANMSVKHVLVVLDEKSDPHEQINAFESLTASLQQQGIDKRAQIALCVANKGSTTFAFKSLALHTMQALNQAYCYLRQFSVLAMTQQLNAKSWQCLQSFYQRTHLLSVLFTHSLPVVLLVSEQALSDYLMDCCHQKQPLWQRAIWQNSAAVLAILGFSWISIHTHQTLKAYAHVVQTMQHQLRMRDAQRSINLGPTQWQVVRRLSRWQDAKARVWQWPLFWRARLDHRIQQVTQWVLNLQTPAQLLQACVVRVAARHADYPLHFLLSAKAAAWFAPNPMPAPWIDSIRRTHLRACVQKLLQAQQAGAFVQQAVWQHLAERNRQQWLQWLRDLRLRHDLNYGFLRSHLSAWLGPQGLANQLLAVAFSQAQIKNPFKRNKLHWLWHRRQSPFLLNEYWHALQLVHDKLSQSPLELTAAVFKQSQHPLRVARQISATYAAHFKDPAVGEAVVSVLQQFLSALWHQSLLATQVHLQDEWQQTVWLAWQQSLHGRFPFSDGHDDAMVADIDYLFKPSQGILWCFVNQTLAPFINLTTFATKLWWHQALQFRANVLAELQQTQRWSHYWYQGDHLRMTWQVFPPLQHDVSTWSLQQGKEGLRYYNGPRQWMVLHSPVHNPPWESNLQVMTNTGLNLSLSTQGPWALWRLLQQAQVQVLSHNQYRLTWRFPHERITHTSLTLKTEAPANWWHIPLLQLPAKLFASSSSL